MRMITFLILAQMTLPSPNGKPVSTNPATNAILLQQKIEACVRAEKKDPYKKICFLRNSSTEALYKIKKLDESCGDYDDREAVCKTSVAEKFSKKVVEKFKKSSGTFSHGLDMRLGSARDEALMSYSSSEGKDCRTCEKSIRGN